MADNELRAWTGDFQKWYQIRSELAVAVYDAGYAAGISFPFPQREVRLLRDSNANLDMIAKAGESQTPLAEKQAESVIRKKEGPDPLSGT